MVLPLKSFNGDSRMAISICLGFASGCREKVVLEESPGRALLISMVEPLITRMKPPGGAPRCWPIQVPWSVDISDGRHILRIRMAITRADTAPIPTAIVVFFDQAINFNDF